MHRLSALILCLVLVSGRLVFADGPLAKSIWLADRTVEYLPGELPIVIGAPHGGTLKPADIPDRTTGVVKRDTNTDLLAVDFAKAIKSLTGKSPHVVICHLHRSKVDCNREASEGTDDHPKALATWHAFHDTIAEAREKGGYGLFIDLHGHSHPLALIELGYRLSREQLQLRGAEFEALAPLSSTTFLGEQTVSFEELLRGPSSLGGLLERHGYPAVPSPSNLDPGESPYFRGGYNTALFGPNPTTPGYLSLQIECPYSGVRDNQSNREKFAKAAALSLIEFLETHTEWQLRTAR